MRWLAALALLSLASVGLARAAPDGFEDVRAGQTYVYDLGGLRATEEIVAITSDEVTVRVVERQTDGSERTHETRGPRWLVRWVKTRWSQVLPTQDRLDGTADEASGAPLQAPVGTSAEFTVSGQRFACVLVTEQRRECMVAGDQRIAIAVEYQRALCARYPFSLRVAPAPRGAGTPARPELCLVEVASPH